MMTGVRRRQTRPVKVRDVTLGGGAALCVQSMTKTPLTDIDATVAQINEISKAGAAMVRLAVPDELSVEALRVVRKKTDVPLVADIHFDYRLAIGSLLAGVDKLRINPGNLGGKQKLAEVARAAKDNGVAIRVGVNAGSLERDLLDTFGGPTPEAIAESALRNVGLLAELGFDDIVISAKSSDVIATIIAYRLISQKCDYPLHVGVTETGPGKMGLVKSAVGIGALLAEGIGDTIRVSLTAPAVEEVTAGKMILGSLGLGQPQVNLVSCPTCGRTRGPLMDIADRVREGLSLANTPITVAVMGCEVNGPGEAREADVGLALTRTGAVLFEHGKVVATGASDQMLAELLTRVQRGLTPAV